MSFSDIKEFISTHRKPVVLRSSVHAAQNFTSVFISSLGLRSLEAGSVTEGVVPFCFFGTKWKSSKPWWKRFSPSYFKTYVKV
jgi:hypothetical protein